MFINEVISYNGAFELLDIQQPRFIEQLDCILKDIENSAIKLRRFKSQVRHICS